MSVAITDRGRQDMRVGGVLLFEGEAKVRYAVD